MSKKKRALVVSGGGSKGAYAGGILDYLINVEKVDYDIYVASSTGTLVQLLTARGDIPKLKKAYTSVSNNDIWKINPFKIISNKNGIIKTKLNLINIIRNFLPKYILLKIKNFLGLKYKRNQVYLLLVTLANY